MPVSDYFRGERFGGQDAQRALDAGHSVAEVQAFVDANQGVVHQDNRSKGVETWGINTIEGGGGTHAGTVTAPSTQASTQGGQNIDTPSVDYASMFADMQSAFQEQMQQYQAAANKQANAMMQQQTQWQQQQQQYRQEQMLIEQKRHQEMLAAQNRVTTSTATTVKQPGSPLAIQPSTPGAAQSAADLGRKPTSNKPVVSGLNIGATFQNLKPITHGIK